MMFTGLMLAFSGYVRAQSTQHPMTVEQLFELVETGSKSLQAMKTGEEIAQVGIEAARSQRLPDVSSSLSFSYIGNVLMTNREFGDVHGYHSPHFGNNFALEARQAVYAGGAINAGIKMAELKKEQATVATQQTREQLRLLALGQYLEIYKLANRMKVYEQNIALTKELIGNITDKHAQGMALRNDITRYELQMESLRLGLRKLQDERDVMNYQLCHTLGLAETEEIIPDSNLINRSFDDLGEENWQLAAIQMSPSLRQSALGMQVAKQNERLARSEMLPKVGVTLAERFDGPITYEVPPINKNINVWYVGVGVSYPISSLFKNNKRVRQAEVTSRQAVENHRVTAEIVNNDVQKAYVYYRQSYAELDTQVKSVELARQNYRVINDRYLNQMALITDMLDASNIRLNAELLEVDARINIAFAYYKLKFAAGNL